MSRPPAPALLALLLALAVPACAVAPPATLHRELKLQTILGDLPPALRGLPLAANVTYLEMPPGVSIPEHHHPGHELLYLIEGSPEARIGSAPWRSLRAGEAGYIPPFIPHEVRNRGSTTARALVVWLVPRGQPTAIRGAPHTAYTAPRAEP